MNLFTFWRFMRQITRDRPVDLDWIQKKGLLAVKLAQIFALRPDIIGVEKCEQLQLLYEQAAEIPEEDVKEIINKVASKKFHENIIEISFFKFGEILICVMECTAFNKSSKIIKISAPELCKSLNINNDLSA